MTVDTSNVEVDATVDGAADLCRDKDLGEPDVVSEHFDDLLPST